jgi:hypothetical protein
MTHATATEAQYRETDIVAQALTQAIAPVGVAIRETRQAAVRDLGCREVR